MSLLSFELFYVKGNILFPVKAKNLYADSYIYNILKGNIVVDRVIMSNGFRPYSSAS